MENTLKLSDYLAIIRRRIFYFAIPFAVVLIGSVAVILALPPIYRSTGKIAVESQQIPAELIRSTVTSYANERIGFIQQRVLTGARLEEMIEKFRLYPEKLDRKPIALVAQELLNDIYIDVVADPYSRGGAIALTVSFEHEDPQIARDVADELVNMFLDENIKTRTERATETTEFLKQQTMKEGEKMRALDVRIAAFKQEHSDALPEHLDLHVNMLERSESLLDSLERESTALEEERRFLETQKLSVGAIFSSKNATGRPPMSPRQQLAAHRTELIEKSTAYTPAHPDIRRLNRRIAALESQIRSMPSDPGESSKTLITDPASIQIEAQISSAKSRLASLQDQKQKLQVRIDRLQAQIIETPQVERGLRELSQNYKSTLKEYEALRSKQQQAELSENLEQDKKAERFVLLEPPTVPIIPVWPDKPKFFAIGLFLALGSGAGLAYAAETLDKTIRGPAMLISVLGHHPLALIPYIENSLDRGPKGHAGKMRPIFIWPVLIIALAVAVAIARVYQQSIALLVHSWISR